MRLKLNILKEKKHKDTATCVEWASADEVISLGDDHIALQWNLMTGENTQLCKLPGETFPTDLSRLPHQGKGGKHQIGSDVFAVTSTDGKFHFLNQAGRLEKSVEAHKGAILSGKFSHDGSAFLTAGEDGSIKIWSRSGMLRSTIAQLSMCIYDAAWSPESDQVLYTQGKQLIIKPLQPSEKTLCWKAHDEIIICVDWNSVNNLIISGSEDCKYKIWDNYGRMLFTSSVYDYPITSIAWSSNGDLFAVGAFNSIRLCDSSGWCHGMEKTSSGSVLSIAWSTDGTQLAAACSDGNVVFAHCVEKRLEWREFEVTLVSRKTIEVKNILNEATETLEMKDRVIKLSIDFNHLVIVTSSQCHVYSTNNFNTAAIFELREGAVSFVLQSEKHFVLADRVGLYIYSYEGRQLCSPKLPGTVQVALLNSKTLSLSPDVLAVRDSKNEKSVFLFDSNTGKPLMNGAPLAHKTEVVQVSLNQVGSMSDRCLALIDKNQDLFLAMLSSGNLQKMTKLAAMVQSVYWNTTVDMLCGLKDSTLLVWFCPSAAFVDKDILPHTLHERECSEMGKNPRLCGFRDGTIVVRQTDGSLVSLAISPYPSRLHHLASGARSEEALRLCRFAKEKSLWGCLAAMSIKERDLNLAEVAYSALGETNKVDHLNSIKNISHKEIRQAEMALFCGNTSEAEVTFTHAGMIFRAIQLNMDLFQWERALELAVRNKTHVDTVLGFRQIYLDKLHRRETSKMFKQYCDGVKVDWEKINSKIELELQNG